MASPYQVAPPQGNLLGSIMDFIGQNRALQLDAGTRNHINAEQGFGGNVDPFQVQKFQGEGQRQQIAGNMDTRAAQEQTWQGDDRNSQAGAMQGLLGNPDLANDPVLGALLQSAGSNPMLGQTIMGMLGQDRSYAGQMGVQDNASQNAMQNWGAQFGAESAMNLSRDMQKQNYALEQIKAQMEGRGPSAGQAALDMQAKVEAARRKYAETGDRSDLLALGQYDEQAQMGRDDTLYNAKQQQTQAEADAVKALMAGNSTNPQAAAQYANPEVGAMKTEAVQAQKQAIANFIKDLLTPSARPPGSPKLSFP